ncbi:AMP-dependent synthetase/ligase [Phytoactinopolyspora limicola]|uniref:AMP-dependent synthetase/ligase n=1 Tax=Phytoactinopolyspora limicola TaxID=2715536 RepID=UPI0014079DEB|nr:AMP-binding protein [Phytoactinopolyspora limicola]
MNTPTTPTFATLPARLLEYARERPNLAALREKHRGYWREWTWEQYATRVAHVAAGLSHLGVGKGTGVAIHAENRPEWLIADLAIQGLGAHSVGIYPTSPAAEVEYLLGHSGCSVLIAEDEEQLDKALLVRDRLPDLRHLVVMEPRGVRRDRITDLLTFAELEELGAGGAASQNFADLVAELSPSDTATLVYTSGTTGPPKAAMLSHHNLAVAGVLFRDALGVTEDDDLLSYLPLCHVAERLLSLMTPLWAGCRVNFGEGGASFVHDMREVQPTVFLGVPRVWERMLATVEVRMADASTLKRWLFSAGMRWGKRIAAGRMNGTITMRERALAWLCDVLVFRALRERLGLLRMRTAMSGAAPISPQVLEFVWALGVVVREGYGQTENTAVCTMTPTDDVRLGFVGRPLDGVEIRIAPDGEILTRSGGVFQGYLGDPVATAEAVDGDGWLHTGDIGEVDTDGFVRITDRKKDVIITAGGKNISPSEIENLLKSSPYVREAVVIGDQRKYLTALIGIERDTVGDWATRRDLPYTTYEDLAAKPQVHELVATVVDQANRQLAQVEQIKRFSVMPKELDHESGELTATQKVKRAAISRAFASQIEAMYP